MILDGDTVFLKPRTWVTSNQQLLILSQEYLKMHTNYVRREFQLESKGGLGFTTQSQLFKKSIITAIADYKGGMIELVNNFSASYTEFKNGYSKSHFPAEWQLYCDWIIEKSSVNFQLASNCNYSISRSILKSPDLTSPKGVLKTEVLLTKLRKRVSKLGSISFHDYK